MYPEFKYVGWKSALKSPTDIVKIGSQAVDDSHEFYQSIYRFDDKVLKHASLADLGSDIKFYSDNLVFDFDCEDDLDTAHHCTQDLSKALTKMDASHHVYFSGNKGYHILIPTIQFGFEPTNDEGILKRMAEAIASRYSQAFDPSIYNKTRVFRVENTVNAKSGLYKVFIPDIHKMTVSDVTALAKEPTEYRYQLNPALPKNEVLCRLYERCKMKVNRTVQASDPREYGALIQLGVQERRNNTLYAMCRDFARRSIPQKDMLQIAYWWNKSLPKPLENEEVEATVNSAYKKGVNELITEDSIFNHIFSAKKALAQLRSLYSNWSQNVVRTGFAFVDEYTMGFFKQEVIFIISRPGNFKTALLSSILRGISRTTGKPTIFFSMEMGVDALTIRHIQMAEGLTQIQVMNGLNETEYPLYDTEFKNVHVIALSSLNTDKVLTIIDKFMEEHGEIGAVGFDYLSLFEGCANDTARTARQATELKTRVAKAGNCPVFCLVQAKREYEGKEGDCEIDKTAGKDSSSIEDSGDYLMGQWGYWHEVKDVDPITGDTLGYRQEKLIYGRFLKSRKFLSHKYQLNPYYIVDIDRAHMAVQDIRFIAQPPKFNHKKDYQE
jgi:hypothetical protein